MTPAAFECLYLHANSIAELAFLRAVAGVVPASAPQLSPEQLAANAADAERMLHLPEEEFDWSALEGVEGFGVPAADGSAPIGGMSGDPFALDDGAAHGDVPAPQGPSFSEAMALSSDDGDDHDGPPDMARYLATMEAARPLLQPRVADCLARADLPAIDAALATLPADDAPLTGALTAGQLARWVDRYEAQDADVVAVVTAIRKLEMLF